ncbi:probable indole-3-acetic acid-amido synthetase GH3.6 isoform X2 [Humulus lupulus]|uniref:probable indole-3-acetic acid-amido synthetase GH3.6 isoform X2 n=1 Tax=Humulus lupulus TaxID=3486 RepID=UPI002B408A66|nr:probable indole-3-acetic acid-amido synthetase GH3.6 isoform X2 [Humulus lupulus]
MADDENLLKKLEDSTRNATRHQLETLQSILEHQGGVRYFQHLLQSYNSPVDVATFRRVVPLSTYEDYLNDVNRLADGPHDHDRDQPLLSVDPLICFFYSSMKPKLIPYYDSHLSKSASYIAHQGSAAILRRLFPPRPSVNKFIGFIYADNVTTTKLGFKVMAASAFPFRNNSSNAASWAHFASISSPKEVILGSNVEHQMYCHLLCGLRNSDLIDSIRAPYAIGLIRAFSLLESKWTQLCDDLENGFLSSEISDVAMRDSVIEVLGGPQLELSKRVKAICQEKNWGGIVRKLWPNIRFVKCVTTGSMKQYYPKLKHFAGETPLLGGDYFASECCIGINLNITQPPDTTRFVLLPTAAYFEFLPFDFNQISSVCEQTVDISDVEVGKMYEVIVTTYRGFYRYRLGDIVRVVGFYNSSPEVEFVMRVPKSQFDIITERDLMSAIEICQLVMKNKNALGPEITEFSSFLDLELNPKQLKVLVEVGEERMFVEEKLEESLIVLREVCSILEDNLGSLYRVKRDKGEVGSLLLTVVKPGSYAKLSQVAIENGISASQYKPPKIIQRHEVAGFLERFGLVTVSLDSVEQGRS